MVSSSMWKLISSKFKIWIFSGIKKNNIFAILLTTTTKFFIEDTEHHRKSPN